MPILQTMLPLYIQLVEKYIAMNKGRYKILTWAFKPYEYKLCEQKRKSAEKLIKFLSNELADFKMSLYTNLNNENLQEQKLPRRSLSMLLDATESPMDTPRPRAASIDEAIYNMNKRTTSAFSPIISYLFKFSNAQVSPRPIGQGTPRSAEQLSQYSGQSNKNTPIESSVPSRSNNSVGFLRELVRAEQMAEPELRPLEGLEYTASESLENSESKLFDRVMKYFQDELENILMLRQRPDLTEHPEGSYDILLQAILDNLIVVSRHDN